MLILGAAGACGIYALSLLVVIIRGPSQEPSPAPPLEEADQPAASQIEDDAREADAMDQDILSWHTAFASIDDAERMLEKGRFSEALQRTETALASTPNLLQLRALHARILAHLDRREDARKELRDVLDTNPDHMPTRYALMRLYLQDGRHESALAVAKWILQTDAYAEEAHRAAATSYMKLNRAALAIPHLKRIIQLQGNSVMLQNELAQAFIQLGQYDRAIELLADLLAQDSSNSVTHYNLAVCYAHQQQIKAATDVLREASDRFGRGFVAAWLESKAFDAIREEAAFVELREQLLDGQAADRPTSSIFEQPVAVE